jgi:hypothetical protein
MELALLNSKLFAGGLQYEITVTKLKKNAMK